MRKDFKTCSFRGNIEQWEDYKLICKLNDSDASKEIRRTIREALEIHEDLLSEYKQREEEAKRFRNAK